MLLVSYSGSNTSSTGFSDYSYPSSRTIFDVSCMLFELIRQLLHLAKYSNQNYALVNARSVDVVSIVF